MSVSNAVQNTAQSDRLRDLIAQGFTVLPITAIGVMLFADVFENPEKIATIYTEYTAAIWATVIFIATCLILQMLVKTFEGAVFRWAVFGITAAFVGFFILHSADHVAQYLREGITLHLPFDTVLYVVGSWTVYLTWKWARLSAQT